jgi:hypothetical protein
VAVSKVRSPKLSISRMAVHSEVFSGWKQIAGYIGVGVRTVQRYERYMGFPVRRPGGKSAGAVIARKAEIDGWIASCPVRSDSRPNRLATEITKTTNRTAARFLQIDSEIALTFSDLALKARDDAKRANTTRTARKAYDTIMRLRKGIELTDVQRQKLDANLSRLKSELESLGQSF